MKYVDHGIYFREFPDEIAYCFNISGCPNKCPECHSKYLWEDIGTPLTIENIKSNIDDNIDFIGLMGGDQDPNYISELAANLKNLGYKVGWYSGKDKILVDINNFDYIKTGPYIAKFGSLDKLTTNQRYYKIVDGKLIDQTYKFWK